MLRDGQIRPGRRHHSSIRGWRGPNEQIWAKEMSFIPVRVHTSLHLDPGAQALRDVLTMISGESNSDYRARLAMEQVQADERRQAELSELTATANAPDARIRAWERTHGLTLPRGETHPVLNSIAAATRLTLEQVREEQRRRRMPTPSTLPTA